MGKNVCNKIRHIVRLHQMLRRWRHRAASRTSPSYVPPGHVAIHVGSSYRRFVIRTSVLNHPAFKQLLMQAEEEYGFDRPGPLSLPCDEEFFEHVLRHVIGGGALSDCCHVEEKSMWREDALPLLRGFEMEKSVW